MLVVKLREEFRGKKLKGTTIDFTNQSKTGALEVPATEFLKITYPSFDLLKTIEATGPEQSRPVVLLGDRGHAVDDGKVLLRVVEHVREFVGAGA